MRRLTATAGNSQCRRRANEVFRRAAKSARESFLAPSDVDVTSDLRWKRLHEIAAQLREPVKSHVSLGTLILSPVAEKQNWKYNALRDYMNFQFRIFALPEKSVVRLPADDFISTRRQ